MGNGSVWVGSGGVGDSEHARWTRRGEGNDNRQTGSEIRYETPEKRGIGKSLRNGTRRKRQDSEVGRGPNVTGWCKAERRVLQSSFGGATHHPANH